MRASVKVLYIIKNKYQDTENTQAFAKDDEILSYNSEVAVISPIKGRL